MSPEQMFGRPIDQRSDIYSLGVIVYEMATGHRPYSTDDPLEVVLTLSKNFLKADEPATNLPAQINEVVTKMLAVKAEDRYQTAGELENALIVLTAPAPAAEAVPRSGVARRVVRALVVLAAVPAAATALGFFTTAWFNYALQRRPPFSDESPAVWLEEGFRSLVTPAIVVVGILFAISAVRFGVRLVSLSGRVDSLLTAGRSRTRELSSRLNFNDPAVAGQAAIAVGVIALVVVIWQYYAVLSAAATFMSTEATLEHTLPILRPPRHEAASYRFALEILMVGFVVALVKVAGLRAHQTVRSGGGALVMLSALFLLAVLMAEGPYRIIWHADFERVMVGDERCYAIGQTDVESLLFCPDAPPPRNRTVPSGTAALRRTGVRESIFSPLETAH